MNTKIQCPVCGSEDLTYLRDGTRWAVNGVGYRDGGSFLRLTSPYFDGSEGEHIECDDCNRTFANPFGEALEI